jgi:glycosyltransferase involved in cell wall biosynthesis
LLVHPSLVEGLGLATLKAAAAGVAVVGFAEGGLVEAVVNEETGLLVPTEDIAALAAAIARLADDNELRQRFATAGRSRMQTGFSIDTMADKHVAVYESVINDIGSK